MSGAGGVYKPASEGLSKYFMCMLDDEDRNSKYRAGIAACFAEFAAENGGEMPTVLDIGVGTGMLSALCLEAGAKHVGRRYWSCAAETASARCSFFQWASPSTQAKADDWFPCSADEAAARGLVLLTLRRGMHGRCVLLPRGADEPTGVHLRFERADGRVLCFVDARVRTSPDAVWEYGLWGGPHRRSDRGQRCHDGREGGGGARGSGGGGGGQGVERGMGAQAETRRHELG